MINAPDLQSQRWEAKDPAWLRYLYERHSRAELAGWARRLHLFRFCRAVGGHANDGDTLTLALRFTGEQDLLALLLALGIAVQRYGPDTPQPVPGHPYSGEEFQRFPSLVRQYPTIGQPSHVQLFGVPCHVWISDRVTITVHAKQNPWEVDEAAVAAAETLERHLLPFAERAMDPPEQNCHCLCPAFYPEIWTA